jgi:hypothetical protein
MSTERQRELKRKRTRRAKIRKIKAKLVAASDARERTKLVEKLWRQNPLVEAPAAASK